MTNPALGPAIDAANATISAYAPSDANIAPILEDTTGQSYAAVQGAASTSAGVAARVIKPSIAERVVYVSPRGDDSADGLTQATSKATLQAALTALGGDAGVIQLGAGTISTNATHTIPSGTVIRGIGRQLGASIISYTGTSALFQATSGTRTYNLEVTNLGLVGPGKTSSSTAIDLVDMSQAKISDLTIGTFGTGISHRSTISGGAVYNRFTNILVNSCTTGALFGPSGSNGSSWHGVKFGNCATAVSITDSNQNNFTACQFEVNDTALFLDCSAAGAADHNSFAFCRFEENTLPWNVNSVNVRDTEIMWPAVFGTWNAPLDSGTRTVIQASSATVLPPPGSVRNVLTRAGSYAMTAGDDVVLFNAGSVAVTATLPDPATVPSGRQYVLYQRGTVALAVAAAAGAVDVTSIAAKGSASYVTDGTNWYAI